MTGLEPIIVAAAAGSVAKITTETLAQKGGKLAQFFGKGLGERTKQAIFAASSKYVENYTERHSILKVLGMREPVSLESVYTNVRLLDERNVLRFESSAAIEQSFRESQQRKFQFQDQNCEKRIGIDLANNKQYLMVLGSPGSGKSTFLRKIGLEARKSVFVKDCK